MVKSPKPRSKIVHIFAVVRLPVEVSADLSDEDAIEAAVANTDLDREHIRGEYADEITTFLVDHRVGNDVRKSTWFNDFGKPMIQAETAKIVTVSTAHMKLKDNNILEELSGTDCYPSIASTGNGYIISLVRGAEQAGESMLPATLKGYGLSAAFLKLWLGMRDAGFGYLQLDADAGTIDGYRTFNW